MDLFDFINPASSLSIDLMENETYDKIISNWSEFINCLPSDDDKQLLLKIISICYFKYQKSIKAYGISDYELFTALLMSILINQQIQIDSMKHE